MGSDTDWVVKARCKYITCISVDKGVLLCSIQDSTQSALCSIMLIVMGEPLVKGYYTFMII